MRRRHALPRALCLAAAACAASASAEVLVGAAGERIPGRWIETRDGVIVFESPLLGRLRVPADRARVEPDAPAPTAVQDPPPPATKAAGIAAAGRPAAHAADAADATAAPSPWSFDIAVKLGADRGSLKTPEDDLDATLKLVRADAAGELHATVDYNYKRTDGVLKDDDLFASLTYDRLLSHERFLAGRGMVATELSSEGYDATRSLSLAYGWRLWEGRQRYLRIGPAVGWLAMERGQERFNGAAAGLYARAQGPLWRRVDFSAELQALDSFQDGRYAALDLRLRHALGERFYLALAWNYLWSDVDIESGITSEWRWVLGWRSDARD